MQIVKKIIYSIIIVVLFFTFIETILFLSGIEPVSVKNDPYVGFSSQTPLFINEKDDKGRLWLTTAKNKQNFFNYQHFPVKKEKSAFRIFSLGGSTTYGRPYDDRTSFSGWLRMLIKSILPQSKIEVINAGGISYASYRIARVMSELIKYEPDLFIVYTGHNEFLENRTYRDIHNTPEFIRDIVSVLSGLRTYSFMESLISPKDNSSMKKTIMNGEVKTLLDQSIGPEAYHRDNNFYRKVIEHFKFNLNRMIDMSKAAGIPVIFVSPASNLKDCSPFKSEYSEGLSKNLITELNQKILSAEKCVSSGKHEMALKEINLALKIDKNYAYSHYLKANILWAMSRFDDSESSFIRARDEDICSLRATSDLLKQLREILKNKNVSFLDFSNSIKSNAQNEIPGNDLFLDHVHLTIEGNRKLALELLNLIVKKGYFKGLSFPKKDKIEQLCISYLKTVDTNAHGNALKNLAKVFAWSGKHEEALVMAKRAMEKIPDSSEIYFIAGSSAYILKRFDTAISYYSESIRLDPNIADSYNNLGAVFEKKGNFTKAMQNYKKAFELEPENLLSLYNIGKFYLKTKNLKMAEKHLLKLVKLNTKSASGYNMLGTVQIMSGKFAQAIKSFQHAISNKDNFLTAKNNLARILSTTPDPGLRNGEKALALSLEVCEKDGYNNVFFLDTLAIARAENGQFDLAIQVLEQARLIAEKVGNEKVLNQIFNKLVLFKKNIPFRIKRIQ